jgi:hypothetical protein
MFLYIYLTNSNSYANTILTFVSTKKIIKLKIIKLKHHFFAQNQIPLHLLKSSTYFD